ncbi:hypothetical protein EON65_28085 [archaeon]|nr:MAG: hypothetical protein EON65_28085 [archaeon]
MFFTLCFRYYDNNTCTELGSFSGSRDHGCFPYHFDNQTFSVKTIYPFEKFYSNADCTGEVLLSDNLAALQDTCAPPPTDDDAVDDDVDSMQFTAYTSSITCTVPSTSTCSSSGNSDDASLSTGALIGIIVGGAVGFMLVLVVIYLIYRSCCKKADANRGGEISVPL